MNLCVGFDNGQMERNSEAQAIWERFASSVSLPFSYTSLVPQAYSGPITGVAAATFVQVGHPDFRDREYARIILTDRFGRLDERHDARVWRWCMNRN